MWDLAQEGRLLLAGDEFIDCPVALAINGQPLVSMVQQPADGRLALAFNVYDLAGHRSVIVREGRVVRKDSHIQLIAEPHRQAAIDTLTGYTLCEIVKDTNDAAGAGGPDASLVFQTFLPGGFLLVCRTDGIYIRHKPVYANQNATWRHCNPALDLALTFSGAPLLLSDWGNVD